MREHSGLDSPLLAAAVDDAAPALLAVWEAARDRAAPRLSWPQLNALLAVERLEGANLRTLADELNAMQSSVSRLCDRLVACGLVHRRPGHADRREIALFLTPSSRRLLKDLRRLRREILAEVLHRMDPLSRAALLRGLREFENAADQDCAPPLPVPRYPLQQRRSPRS
ncbi:MarR family winged helix-turn-helix transcriptional regulator [Actinoplanes sp. NPDC051859]|uniref:MarR family winged helix-turn-helix transcriptional regulator n=1 Tax=Actinoplanes sp. NPDC051859 TaxID=3363909 RepID=UPI0037A4B7A8